MTKLNLIVLLLLAAFAAQSQTYSIIPGPTVNGNVEVGGYLFLEIKMQSLAIEDINVVYELISNSCDTGWSMTLCDYQSCFPLIPTGRTMDPIPPGDYGFLKLTVNPFINPGAGTIKYKIWETSTPSQVDTLTFNINVLISIASQQNATKLITYPNPASDIVTIASENGLLPAGEISVYSAAGAKVMSASLHPSKEITIPVDGWVPGIYFLVLRSDEGEFATRLNVH